MSAGDGECEVECSEKEDEIEFGYRRGDGLLVIPPAAGPGGFLTLHRIPRLCTRGWRVWTVTFEDLTERSTDEGYPKLDFLAGEKPRECPDANRLKAVPKYIISSTGVGVNGKVRLF